MSVLQTAINPTQTALYSKLVPGGVLDSTLAGLGVVGVFDFRAVPQNQAFDYITLGDSIETPENCLGTRGYIVTHTIHLWSRQRGTEYPSAILSRINQLIDQQDLSLPTGLKHVSTMYNRAILMNDPDGLTVHGAIKYDIFVQEG